MELNKISIITPTFNRREMLETAIKNVMAQAQDYPNLEHIVVDGGSNDGTQDMLKRYPQVLFISEPDRGMYDALNKGIKISSGEIIGFLNTDDLYASNIFRDIVAKFEDESVMAVAGRAVVFIKSANGDLEVIGHYSPSDRSLLECSTIGNNYFNAWFFRRSVFESIGNFNANYRIVADRDFMLRYALKNLSYSTLDKLVYQYRQHSDSMTMDVTDQKLERIVNEHIELTGFYLQQVGLSPMARDLVEKLRTRDTMEMASRSLRKLRIPRFLHYMLQGQKYDRYWLLKFSRQSLKPILA